MTLAAAHVDDARARRQLGPRERGVGRPERHERPLRATFLREAPHKPVEVARVALVLAQVIPRGASVLEGEGCLALLERLRDAPPGPHERRREIAQGPAPRQIVRCESLRSRGMPKPPRRRFVAEFQEREVPQQARDGVRRVSRGRALTGFPRRRDELGGRQARAIAVRQRVDDTTVRQRPERRGAARLLRPVVEPAIVGVALREAARRDAAERRHRGRRCGGDARWERGRKIESTEGVYADEAAKGDECMTRHDV